MAPGVGPDGDTVIAAPPALATSRAKPPAQDDASLSTTASPGSPAPWIVRVDEPIADSPLHPVRSSATAPGTSVADVAVSGRATLWTSVVAEKIPTMPLNRNVRGRTMRTARRSHAAPSTGGTIDCGVSPPWVSASMSGDESGTGFVISTVMSPIVPVAVRAGVTPDAHAAVGRNVPAQSGAVTAPGASVRLART